MSKLVSAGRLLPVTVNFVPIGPDAGSTPRSLMSFASFAAGATGPGKPATPASAGGFTGCGSARARGENRSVPAAAPPATIEASCRKRLLLNVVPFLTLCDDGEQLGVERHLRPRRDLVLRPVLELHHELVLHDSERVGGRNVPASSPRPRCGHRISSVRSEANSEVLHSWDLEVGVLDVLAGDDLPHPGV